jgi:hypothetical protein
LSTGSKFFRVKATTRGSPSFGTDGKALIVTGEDWSWRLMEKIASTIRTGKSIPSFKA